MFFASQGDGHHPSMAFHASFVALFNGEGQRVVSGIASGFSCQYGVEGFDVRTIKHITTGTCLEKYRIEVGLFQAVEDIDQFFFLLPDTCRSGDVLYRSDIEPFNSILTGVVALVRGQSSP